MSRTTRISALAAITAAGALALTACGSGSSTAGATSASAGAQGAQTAQSAGAQASQATQSAGAGGAAGATADMSGTAAGSGGTGGSSATPGMRSNCTTAVLKAALRPNGQEMNSKYYDLTLTNTGSGSCGLEGYPGLSLTDSSGHRIGKPATRSHNGTESMITLGPGQSAHAVVETPDKGVTGGKCWPVASRFVVYPPNNTKALNEPAPKGFQVCGNTFTVGPFTAKAP